MLGAGCLSWQPDGPVRVQRHLMSWPAAIHFDDDSGRLTVTREATDAPGRWLTPFAGGVAHGLGSRAYDRELALIAAHPSAPDAASSHVIPQLAAW